MRAGLGPPLAALILALAGPVLAQSADTAAPQRVYMVVGGHRVTGLTKPDRVGGGELTLVDESDPTFACAGVYGPAKGGGLAVSLACSNGIRLRSVTHPSLDRAGLGRGKAQPTALRNDGAARRTIGL